MALWQRFLDRYVPELEDQTSRLDLLDGVGPGDLPGVQPTLRRSGRRAVHAGWATTLLRAETRTEGSPS